MGSLASTSRHALVVALASVAGLGCTNEYAVVDLAGHATTASGGAAQGGTPSSGAGGAGGQDLTSGAGATPTSSAGGSASIAGSSSSGPGAGGTGGMDPCPGCELPFGVSTWVGTYICNQGLTALDLEITREGDDDLTAVNSFHEHPDNPGVPSGSFTMAGTYDPATHDVLLDGVQWIDQPNGYNLVDLVGIFEPPSQRIAGDVIFSGCSTFEIFKQ